MNSPRLEELIVSEINRGSGTDDDPVRIVTQVHRKDGAPVAENDPFLSIGLSKVATLLIEEKLKLTVVAALMRNRT